jgi:hypothetical protein
MPIIIFGDIAHVALQQGWLAAGMRVNELGRVNHEIA